MNDRAEIARKLMASPVFSHQYEPELPPEHWPNSDQQKHGAYANAEKVAALVQEKEINQ